MIAARQIGGQALCKHVLHGNQARWMSPASRQASAWTPLIVRLWSNALQASKPKPTSRQWRSVSASAAGSASSTEKKKLVFLGTPEVAALVLRKLLDAAAQPYASFEVAAVVSQPGRPRGRGNKRVPQPSPVEALAVEAGLEGERILCPERATDKHFLEALRALAPDLCVTAAYGNYLPTTFLSIPAQGTLNIHPSLLPKYRGAAPVQRSLQDGVTVSGVTLLYTVKQMDAGPVLAQRTVPVDPDIQAPELLDQLFTLGTELLLENLELVWSGQAQQAAQPQDEAEASHAAKLTREEALLDFGQPAVAVHNKVRGFAGWPGTYHVFRLSASASISSCNDGDSDEEMELKVVRTHLAPSEQAAASSSSGGDSSDPHAVLASKQGMFVRCGDGSRMELVEVQAPGKRVMAAADFANGLKGRVLRWKPTRAPATAAAY